VACLESGYVTRSNDVGKSSRTPFKHWVLNAHLGKIAGVLSTRSSDVPASPTPFLCVDLCAGDGTQSDSHQCSPAIINRHCSWLHARGINCSAVFIEHNANTFDMLQRNIIPQNHPHRIELIHGDAREYRVEPTCKNQAIFVNCDPNAISNMPLADEFAESLTPTTTMTMTLGCNVDGLKRLSREKREEWFEYADRVIRNMPTWHDAIAVRLIRDASQWAYLTRLPRKWAHRQAVELRNKGNSLWPNGVEVAIRSESGSGFVDLLTRLFLTEKEYHAQ